MRRWAWLMGGTALAAGGWVFASARRPSYDWEVSGQDLGTTLRLRGWRFEGSPARAEAFEYDAFTHLPAGASYQIDQEGFAFRPTATSPVRRLRTEAEGFLETRYLFRWTGKGKPPATVKVWVTAQSHGSDGAEGFGRVAIVDRATQAAPPLDPEETPKDAPGKGKVDRHVLLKVVGGEAGITVHGAMETGGTGKWSAYLSGCALPDASYRMTSGPITMTRTESKERP